MLSESGAHAACFCASHHGRFTNTTLSAWSVSASVHGSFYFHVSCIGHISIFTLGKWQSGISFWRLAAFALFCAAVWWGNPTAAELVVPRCESLKVFLKQCFFEQASCPSISENKTAHNFSVLCACEGLKQNARKCTNESPFTLSQVPKS